MKINVRSTETRHNVVDQLSSEFKDVFTSKLGVYNKHKFSIILKQKKCSKIFSIKIITKNLKNLKRDYCKHV